MAATIIGVLALLTGKSYNTFRHKSFQEEIKSNGQIQNDRNHDGQYTAIRSILLASGPIFINLILVVIFHMNTALALGLVLTGMAIILKLDKVKIKDMLVSSIDYPVQWGVLNILLFQQMLEATGTIDQIVSVFASSGIPVVAIISLTAFITGLLVGSPQGFVAVAFPLVLPLAQGSMDVVAMSYLCGVFGTMTSPAHLCQIVTLQYFQADFLKSIIPIIFMEIGMVVFGFIYIYIF
ncbi:MAG: DUF401 family protein [Peptococcaceae bacterium]|nr:DUF401 family protein [Peptococcaceae bacterium]